MYYSRIFVSKKLIKQQQKHSIMNLQKTTFTIDEKLKTNKKSVKMLNSVLNTVSLFGKDSETTIYFSLDNIVDDNKGFEYRSGNWINPKDSGYEFKIIKTFYKGRGGKIVHLGAIHLRRKV